MKEPPPKTNDTMIRAAIICPDQDLATKFQEALTGFRNVGIARVLHQYPNEAKLPAFLKAADPELIFLSAERASDATDVALRITTQSPGLPIVAISRTCDGPTMLEVLRAGAKDFVAPPFEARTIQAMLQRVETMLANRPEVEQRSAPIFAFLPAKAGAGATTIAVNTSLALVRNADTKALLIDLDLNSGLVGFMMSLKSQYSVLDAAENAPDMDETLWSKIVGSVGNLDVLPSGTPNREFRIEGSQVRRILDFAQRNYDAVSVDLSGMMEKYAVEMLQQAKQIFLVCTPEVPSLHLAGGKLDILRSLDLDERVSLIVNRAENSHRTIPLAEIEKLLRRKISFTLPNAYEATREAGITGKPVKPTSELGMGFAKLAQTMLPATEPVVERRRSILDVFARPRSVLAKT
jgi:pilus assembly protein CpaE